MNLLNSEHPWVPDVINTEPKITQEIRTGIVGSTIAQEVYVVSRIACSS